MDSGVVVREFDEARDLEAVEKLERSCELGSKRSLSIFTDMMGDPLCRIRLYRVRVMLVAELVRNNELVGVVRGCIKYVGTGSDMFVVKLGCMLGLRVSPNHRRMGIGLKLVKSVEAWAVRNGAQYISLAAEENNVASTNLFTLHCNYVKLSPLVIVVQPIHEPRRRAPRDVMIEKLRVDHAVSLYNDKLGGKDFFPADIDAVLRQELSLGTWVSFFKDECKEKSKGVFTDPSSWAMVSIWNTSEVYKLRVRGASGKGCFPTRKIGAFPCFLVPSKASEFLFLYGVYGEGESVGELVKALWGFACNLARGIKGCQAIVTELGAYDPLRGHLPVGSSTSCITDLWFLKRVGDSKGDDDDQWTRKQPFSSLFVDPREF